MLKSGLGSLEANPWPHNVTTGALPPAPGPIPPFPPSTRLRDAVFGAPAAWAPSIGDTWPSATAANGELYAWGCDSAAGPMGCYRIDGDALAGEPLTPVLVSESSWEKPVLNFTALCGWLGRTGSYPYINIKPGGMMALPASPSAPNGTLAVGVSCQNYGDDAGFNRQHNLAGFVAVSSDLGVTWRNATPSDAFLGRFAAPVFVYPCGASSASCATQDPWVYSFFPGAYDNSAYWDNNDALFLSRVAADSYTSPADYEFFVGLNGLGAPLWSSDALQAQPALEFANMVGENVITYHAPLGLYLCANYGFIDDAGNPRPWHTEPFMSPHRTQLTLLEAENPWGPWRVFYTNDDSPPAPGLYTPSFPTRYMRPSEGGKVDLVMFFACLGGPSSCKYTLNCAFVRFYFIVGAFSLSPVPFPPNFMLFRC